MKKLIIYCLMSVSLYAQPRIWLHPRTDEIVVYENARWNTDEGTNREFMVARKSNGFCLILQNHSATDILYHTSYAVLYGTYAYALNWPNINWQQVPIYWTNSFVAPLGAEIGWIPTKDAAVVKLYVSSTTTVTGNTASLYMYESEQNCVDDKLRSQRSDFPYGWNYAVSGVNSSVSLGVIAPPGYQAIIKSIDARCSGSTGASISVTQGSPPTTKWTFASTDWHYVFTQELSGQRGIDLTVTLNACGVGNTGTLGVSYEFRQ